MAGLQILVLTMLVRIQLGQQANPGAQAPGFFVFAPNPSLFVVRRENKKSSTKGVLDLLEH